MVNDEVTYLHIQPTGNTVFLDKDRETRILIISQSEISDIATGYKVTHEVRDTWKADID